MFALLQETDLHWVGFARLAPELILVAVSLAVLLLDLVWKERNSSRLGWISIAGLALAAFVLASAFESSNGEIAFGIVVVDKFGNFFKLFTVASLAAVVFFVLQDKNEKKEDDPVDRIAFPVAH